MGQYTLGVDIGGTKCAVVLGKTEIFPGQMEEFILDKRCFPTEVQRGPEHTIACFFKAIDEILRTNHTAPEALAGIGISCGGPLNHDTGVICDPPNLYGWNHVPIVKLFQDRYHVPAFLQNDANACALAEWKFGAARGCSNVIFLTFGTGMGAGLIFDGKLYCGTSDMAGEVGHVRLTDGGPVGFGKIGSFEGFCSGNGIAQLARTVAMEAMQKGQPPAFCPTIAQLDTLDAKKVAEAADAGDPLAREVYRLCGENLGKGLAILIDILNPEMIVLGSIFQRSPHLLWPAAKEVLAREALPQSLRQCRIVPSLLGEHIGDFAAISIILSQL